MRDWNAAEGGEREVIVVGPLIWQREIRFA